VNGAIKSCAGRQSPGDEVRISNAKESIMLLHGKLCGLLVLAPVLAFADDGISLVPANNEAPVSALNVYAELPDSVRIEILGDRPLDTGNSDPAVTERLEQVIEQLQLAQPGGKYWIGLGCESPDDTLRSQLGLEKETGLAIVDVADDSPADAAGLKAGDVVTLARVEEASHEISDGNQLAALIQQAQTKPIELTVLRGGKPMVVMVTPAERPGLTIVKLERDGEPRALPGRRSGAAGEESARKAESSDKRHAGRQRRGAKRGDREHRRRQMADRGRGGWERQRGRHDDGDRGSEVRGHDHPRHRAQRGPRGRFGRLAMMRHGRFGGFAHRGPRQGRHFANRFAMLHRGERSGRYNQSWMAGRGPQSFQQRTDTNQQTTNIADRLESLVARLERIAGPEGLGRFGSGGFRPPAAERDRGRSFDRGQGPPPGWQREPSRSSSGGDAPNLDQMRMQLRQLQEQQDQMMRAIRNLAETVEKSNRK
jgi:hypothetical protein